MRSSWCRAVAPAIALVASVTLAGLARGVAGLSAAAAAPVLLVTGDIDGCNEGEDTAELAARVAAPIATVGDNAYPSGSSSEYAKCYAPTWGALKDRTHPVPGNHDYDTSKAAPYYEYFGAAAGDPTKGWYSYDVGTWHVVALNSNCGNVDCGEQTSWLEADLTAHPSACILAYWHHPRFTSGTSGGDAAVGDFWKVLYDHRASLVFNGHDHDYERFAPQNPSGRADPGRGIREFVVGTGGAALGSIERVAPNSEVRHNRAYGLLELTLRPDGYDWRFLATGGDTFTDSGSDTCRGTAPASAPPTTVAPAAPPAPAEPDTAAQPPAEPSEPEPCSPPAGPTPTNPPTTSRRRPGPATTPPTTVPARRSPARPAPSGPSTAAGKPPATRSATPAVDVGTPVPPITMPPPTMAPSTTAPAGEVDAGPPELAQPGVVEPTGDPGDPTLALALSSLIDQSAPEGSSTDRRAIALVALALLVVDGAALAAFGKRNGWWQLSS
jgi:hypothetical protein